MQEKTFIDWLAEQFKHNDCKTCPMKSLYEQYNDSDNQSGCLCDIYNQKYESERRKRNGYQ